MTIHAAKAVGGGPDARGIALQCIQQPPATSHQPLTTSARGHDTPELKEAFTNFVGQTFFGELLKQMRATVDKSAFFHGGMGEDIFQSQLDQILVERITDSSGPTFSEPMYQLLTARRT